MAPRKAQASSDSDSDAPEAVTLSQSKLSVKQKDDAVRQVEAAVKSERKAKNRERDTRLKAQAEGSKRKRVDEGAALEARMARAMQEAQEEMDEGEGEDEVDGDFDGLGQLEGGSDDEDMSDEDESAEDDSETSEADQDEVDNDQDMNGSGHDPDDADSDEDEDESLLEGDSAAFKPASNPNYLPDHLFTSAFAQKPVSTSHPPASGSRSEKPYRRKKHRGPSRKDTIIGSRAIRALATTTDPDVHAARGTQPSRKVRSFVDRSLGYRDAGQLKKRGWERKSAHLGVMKVVGPAARFVRST